LLEPGKLPGPLLARLIEMYRTPDDASVSVPAGYGRDAAVIEVSGESLIVKSDPITFATDRAAHYLVAVNANDIACLGGIPRWMTVVALLPESSTTETLVESLFHDLRDACAANGISLIGGHTEITLGIDRPLLIGTLIGTAGPRGILEPGGASAGDEVYLTRWAGIEGTALLARERTTELAASLGAPLVRAAAKLLRSPGISVVSDASILRDVAGVTALHDPTEGGVATAIHEMAEASSLGAEVITSSIPMLPETQRIAKHFGLDPLGMLGSGALLVTASPSAGEILRTTAEEHHIPLTHIGVLVEPGNGIVAIGADARYPLPRYDRDEVTRVL
jgi:hydrogenase maturation factor